MKVFSVIVTYGNRFCFLEQAINSCIEAKIDKIIVIDNASNKNSREQLQRLEKNTEKLIVIYLNENTGSAGGFKRGLQEAYKNDDCEYVLTLDDDNIIERNSLIKLQNILNYLENFKQNMMLGMYRPIWDWDRKAVENGWIKTYKSNNFIGFNFLVFIKQFFKKKFSANTKSSKFIDIFPLQPAKVSAMGGLFFQKTIIDRIGYPNEDFFVYADDHEYTYRFTKNGGKIFLCSEITINDIDQTSTNDNNESIGYFHKDFSDMKMYYSIRNHTYFSKEFLTNKFFFYGNIIAVSILHFRYIFKIPFSLFRKRYKLYLRALRDGLNSKLGKTF